MRGRSGDLFGFLRVLGVALKKMLDAELGGLRLSFRVGFLRRRRVGRNGFLSRSHWSNGVVAFPVPGLLVQFSECDWRFGGFGFRFLLICDFPAKMNVRLQNEK